MLGLRRGLPLILVFEVYAMFGIHPIPPWVEGKTMAVFVSLPTFHQQGAGWFCLSVGQKQVQPLLIHVCASQRCLKSGTKTAMLSFVEDRDRLGITACSFPPLTAGALCWLTNVVSSAQVPFITPSLDTRRFIFVSQRDDFLYYNKLPSLSYSATVAVTSRGEYKTSEDLDKK